MQMIMSLQMLHNRMILLPLHATFCGYCVASLQCVVCMIIHDLLFLPISTIESRVS